MKTTEDLLLEAVNKTGVLLDRSYGVHLAILRRLIEIKSGRTPSESEADFLTRLVEMFGAPREAPSV